MLERRRLISRATHISISVTGSLESVLLMLSPLVREHAYQLLVVKGWGSLLRGAAYGISRDTIMVPDSSHNHALGYFN